MSSRQRLQCAKRIERAIETALSAAVGYTSEMKGYIDEGIDSAVSGREATTALNARWRQVYTEELRVRGFPKGWAKTANPPSQGAYAEAEKEARKSANSARRIAKEEADASNLNTLSSQGYHVNWETPSNFSVRCYKQETDELRGRLWNGYNEEGRDDLIRLTAWNPNRFPDTGELKTGVAPNFVHSVDASVVHIVLANTPEDQPTVSVHDAFGTHIRNVADTQQRFRETFHHIYSKMHPLLIARDALPTSEAEPPEELISHEWLREIRVAPHQTV